MVGGKQDQVEKLKPCEEDLKDQEPVSVLITTRKPAAVLSFPSSCFSSLLAPSSATQQPQRPEDADKDDDDRHLARFTHLLTTHALGLQASWPHTPAHIPQPHPRLPVPAYAALYARHSRRADGAHFVVTQHDHPVAGPHYDLRLQIGPASSCSWAVMYGLPGDPNARGRAARAGAGALRNATETRVHCLWNHLVESGGWATGSLLVWDTGAYEVLPPRRRPVAGGGSVGARSARGRRDAATPPRDTTGSSSDSDIESDFDQGKDGDAGSGASRWADMTQQQKLAASFASRKIRLRLRGARLPRNYVINLRLTREDDAAGRARAARAAEKNPVPRRRRREGGGPQQQQQQQQRPQYQAKMRRARQNTGPDTSSSGSEEEEKEEEAEKGREPGREDDADLSAMDRELRELEDAEVRRTNAYPGAINSIGSIHQRRWYLSLDAAACGFERTRRDGGRVWWEPPGSEEGAKDEEKKKNNEDNRLRWPFYVLGPEHERSVVTGRLGADVLRDEGVVGYVGRKGWRPILR